ncbi:MAG: phosphate ABC transporter permease subunit PstC [Candidatus Limnocylindrales bacterium]
MAVGAADPVRSRLASGGLTRLLRHGDRPFAGVTLLAALGLLLLVVAIGWTLWQDSAIPRAAFGWAFLTTTAWDPALTFTFGALPYIEGTLVTSLLALLIAVPVGLGAAIFLAELAPRWVSRPLGLLIELLAAVPSVVYGLWGLFVLVPVVIKPLGGVLSSKLGFLPLFSGPIFGPSRLAAGILLAIMVLPTIAVISREVFQAIPAAQREGAMALGATRWEVVRQVLVPYGLSGFLGAIILGLGRAFGETIAVTMVIGNNLDLSASLLHPGYTMASIIANEFTEATSDIHLQALIEIGLVLFAMTLIINFLAQLLIWRVRRQVTMRAAA